MDPPLQQPAWPNPVGPLHPAVGEAPPNLVLSGVFPAPFYQTDWPNPLRPKRNPISEVWPNFLVLIDAGIKPFAQYDWPVPRAPRQRETAGFIEPWYSLWVSVKAISISTPTVSPLDVVNVTLAPRYVVNVTFD